ncbi:hypothetical protein MUN78_07445 [Leucobacter allii]|uniref:ABC transporter permease n=1 Tax=Leucobacter allii TaxID=2932247 RepID=A0ABY4FQV5_9MICO|nr:hypothetical protein [Leucobacter allii]UOQ58648.1 hypothetical protein MUN78_07445 [Leucobacter allii]
MTGKSSLSFWDAIELLSDRGTPVHAPEHSVRSVSFPAAIISLTTLVIAEVPLVLLHPDRADGTPMLLSLFVFPMIACGLIIELVVLCKLRLQSPLWTFLWWPLVVLPIGLLVLSLGPLLAHPGYFAVTGLSSAVGVMCTFALLVGLGLGLGFVFWPLVVFPLRILGLAVCDAIRGERIAAFRVYVPLIFLAIPAISLLAVASLDFAESGRVVARQLVLALLGIPGEYGIAWEPGLWIVRGIALALIGSAIWARARSRRDDTRTGA